MKYIQYNEVETTNNGLILSKEWFDTQTVLEETGQIEERKNVVEEDSDYYYEQNANV